METATHVDAAPPGIAELIREARENPAKPVIQNLVHEHEIVGLHGPPEVFKTILTLQLAESLATGKPFLGVWRVPRPQTVYFFETEMSVVSLGGRLSRMFAGQAPPEKVIFADEKRLKKFKRAGNLAAKFALLNEWVQQAAADVVIVDTCNPFFRGKESANDETTAGAFFDHLEALPAPTKLFVRHNHKPRVEDAGADAAARIRGSGQFADVPDLLLEMRRTDKRIQQGELSITKFRHGGRPDNVTLWFDTGTFRLISLPPVIQVLQRGPLSRGELLEQLERRFGISQRLADDMINDQRQFLQEYQQGHQRMFEIDRDAAVNAAEWLPRAIAEGLL